MVRFHERLERLLHVVGKRSGGRLFIALARHPEHAEDEHRVIGGDRAAAFGNDVRVWHTRVIAHRLDVVNDIVSVFLQRVIHTRFEVRLGTVIVNSQAAAHIEIGQAGTAFRQIGIDCAPPLSTRL